MAIAITSINIIPFIVFDFYFIFLTLYREILQVFVPALLLLSLSLGIYSMNCCLIIRELSLLTKCIIYIRRSFSIYY